MNYFDKTEIPKPRLNAVVKISKWDKYEFVSTNEMKFIRGYNLESNDESHLFEYKTINKPNILYELLALQQKLKVRFHHMQKEISDGLSNEDIENILKFCKSNGLPFWRKVPTVNFCLNQEHNETKDIALKTIMHDVVPFANENYLHIASFVQCLHWLKIDFLRIIAANNWEEDTNVFHLLNQDDKRRIKSIRIWQSKDKETGLYMPHLNPYMTYWNDKKMQLELNCENIIHFAAYQICLLQQAQDYTGGYAKRCSKCGLLFVAAKAQQKYCHNPCTPQAYYSVKKNKAARRN